MPIRPLSMERWEAAQSGLRDHLSKQRRARASREVNMANGVALASPPPVPFRGRQYPARILAVEEGWRINMCFRRAFGTPEAPAAPPQTEEEFADRASALRELAEIFYAALDPKPRDNPFTSLSAEEVGFLAGFFSTSLMMLPRPPKPAGTGRNGSTGSTL